MGSSHCLVSPSFSSTSSFSRNEVINYIQQGILKIRNICCLTAFDFFCVRLCVIPHTFALVYAHTLGLGIGMPIPSRNPVCRRQKRDSPTFHLP